MNRKPRKIHSNKDIIISVKFHLSTKVVATTQSSSKLEGVRVITPEQQTAKKTNDKTSITSP